MAASIHPGRALRDLAEHLDISPGRLVLQGVLLVAGVVALYVVAPELVELFSVAPVVLGLDWVWLGLMVGTEVTSLVALAFLVRTLLPTAVSRIDVLLAQLAANAASLAVPGGAAVGATVSGRLLVRSGAETGDAAAALAASSLLSTLTSPRWRRSPVGWRSSTPSFPRAWHSPWSSAPRSRWRSWSRRCCC